jgi:hypothetical protein
MTPNDIEKLKQKIYSHLNEMEDDTALQMLQEAVAVYSSATKKEILDELTPEQKQRLEESTRQTKDGKTLSHEEAMLRAKEWLSK